MDVCVECEYYLGNLQLACSNEELPITDFVKGTRSCEILNTKGDCEGFRRKGEPESIYESKADETLAYRGPLLPEKEH